MIDPNRSSGHGATAAGAGAAGVGAGAAGAGAASSFSDRDSVQEPGQPEGNVPPAGTDQPVGGRHGDQTVNPAASAPGRPDSGQPVAGAPGEPTGGQPVADGPGQPASDRVGGAHAGPVETGSGAAPVGEPPASSDPSGTAPGQQAPGQSAPAQPATGQRAPGQPGGADVGDQPGGDDLGTSGGGRSHLDPEERPGAEEQGKPGLFDKVRGKVEDLRGRDEGPRT